MQRPVASNGFIQVPLGKLTNVEKITFNRVVDDVSEATVDLVTSGNGLRDEPCCRLVDEIDPWAHELAIYRDSRLVWIGPILDLDYDNDSGDTTVYARDRLAWADKRILDNWTANPTLGIFQSLIRPLDGLPTEGYFSTLDQTPPSPDDDMDVATIFQVLFNQAYNKYGTAGQFGLTISGISATNVRTIYEVYDEDRRMAGDELRTLARTGIDFTVVTNQLICGGQEIDPTTNIQLTDAHWLTLPKTDVKGIQMRTIQYLAGGGGGAQGYDEDATFRAVSANTATYGFLDVFSNEPDLLDDDITVPNNGIESGARGRLDLNDQPVGYVSGGQLGPNAPVTIDQLIPGIGIQLRLKGTCRPILTRYRVHKVDVEITPDNEDISLELYPIGAGEAI
jgi:hypothetical protein